MQTLQVAKMDFAKQHVMVMMELLVTFHGTSIGSDPIGLYARGHDQHSGCALDRCAFPSSCTLRHVEPICRAVREGKYYCRSGIAV
jgi:hypothetical protein